MSIPEKGIKKGRPKSSGFQHSLSVEFIGNLNPELNPYVLVFVEQSFVFRVSFCVSRAFYYIP
jgi:hypothetical protein